MVSPIPPPNYGLVDLPDGIHRSGFPENDHIDFMKSLNLRAVLRLVGTEPSEEYNTWLSEENISLFYVEVGKNKPGKSGTSTDSMCEALLIVCNSANYPLHIHCNQGKHRTGCVVACLRKVQRLMDMDEIISEYRTYAGEKSREGDIQFIKAFDPADFDAYAEYVKRSQDLLELNEMVGRMTEPVVKPLRGPVQMPVTPSPYPDVVKELMRPSDEGVTLPDNSPAVRRVCVH